MRQILSIKLHNGAIINVVGDTGDKQRLKQYAVSVSPRIFADLELRVTADMQIANVEVWAQDKRTVVQNGCRQYLVGFILNNAAQCLPVTAAGVKGAYNSVKMTYGISENPIMLIYEVGQQISYQSAVTEARKLVQSKESISELKRSLAQLCTGVKEVAALFSLINDYKDNKYTGIKANKLIAFVASMIYCKQPSKYRLDINGDTMKMDCQQAVKWIVSELMPDIQEYCKWLAGDDSLMV